MKTKLFKGLEFSSYVIGFSMMSGIVSYAYIDPSVTTYAIQMAAGVVLAVGAVAGIYWRKAKKKINEKLGIDENKNKTVEEDIVEVSSDKK